MEFFERESIVSRMMFGNYIFKMCGLHYMFHTPTLEDKHIAQRIFEEQYQYGLWSGMYTDEEIKEIMDNIGFWTPEEELKLKTIKQDIENLKVKIFESTFRSNIRQTARKALRIAEHHEIKLESKKHSYDHITAYGYALSCKVRYLLLRRLKHLDGSDATEMDYLLDKLVSIHNRNALNDTKIREVARTEPWRSLWLSSDKNASVFRRHPYELNDEQKSLLCWSMTYDGVYQNMDCPHDSVIDDDDMLDGWMIVQKRKREAEMNKKEGDEKIPDKVRNSQEVFVMVDNAEDAKAVNSMNTLEGEIIKRKKFAALDKHGSLSDSQMPDVRERLAMEMNKMNAQKGKK